MAEPPASPVSIGPLRIGILSSARIARAFVQALRGCSRITVSAVASRDAGKAQAFAAELKIPRWFASYEELLAAPDIDAIYNPLPNSMHAEWSIKAVRAGKHVLCEKPLAMSGTQARDMFEAARACRVHLVEAFPYRAQPQTLKLRELLAGGAIGKVRLIQASFGGTLTDPGDIRWDAALGGGALMDAGTYCVSLIRMAAGARPRRVNATAQWSSSDPASAVDRTMAATLEFADGLLAQITCSYDSALHRQALLVGSVGTIQTTFSNHTSAAAPGSLTLSRLADGQSVDSEVHTAQVNGFLAEAESFVAMIQQGPEYWNGASEEESVDIALTLEAILSSARLGRPVDIP